MKPNQDNALNVLKNKKSVLFIAHPGHELRVYHWFKCCKPTTFILTDGSGRTKQPRLDATTSILNHVGAKKGGIYGKFSDADIYEIILEKNSLALTKLCCTIADFLITEKIEYVAGDAIEGYNPSHDVCRYILNAAVLVAEKETGQKILNYDFTLVGKPDAEPVEFHADNTCVMLDEFALQQKLIIAKHYQELQYEVDLALSSWGENAFSKEWLRTVNIRRENKLFDGVIPYYELYGEKQVASGCYESVIRYKEHVHPLIEEFSQIMNVC